MVLPVRVVVAPVVVAAASVVVLIFFVEFDLQVYRAVLFWHFPCASRYLVRVVFLSP